MVIHYALCKGSSRADCTLKVNQTEEASQALYTIVYTVCNKSSRVDCTLKGNQTKEASQALMPLCSVQLSRAGCELKGNQTKEASQALDIHYTVCKEFSRIGCTLKGNQTKQASQVLMPLCIVQGQVEKYIYMSLRQKVLPLNLGMFVYSYLFSSNYSYTKLWLLLFSMH